MRYDLKKRAFLVKKYHETKNCTLVQRAWRSTYRHEATPHHNTIMSLVSKFDSMGFVNDLHSGRAMDVEKHEETKNQLKVLIKANPKLSLRKAASVVGVSHMTVRTIFIDELHLKPYKYQMCHELKPSDYEARLEFARWFLSKPENITQYFIVSDEAYFYLKEALNKQNDRMWSESRPDEWIEAPLHDEKIHVWCAISAKRIFGPFYFEESVKAINYSEMLAPGRKTTSWSSST